MAGNNTLIMERLKNVIMTDANNSMDTLIKVIKSDIYCLLSEYMILAPESVKVSFDIDEDGAICLYIGAKTNQVISAGYTIPD